MLSPEAYSPIVARTRTFRRPTESLAYDCTRLMIIRDGSAVLFGEFGRKSVGPGDVTLLAANTACAAEPAWDFTATTIYLDPDYMIDQVFWQHVGELRDRLDAQDLAAKLYADPAQILRLGDDGLGLLIPWLDELVMLSDRESFAQDFYRMQSLWFSIAHVLASSVKNSPIGTSPTQHAMNWASQPRARRYAPLRAEVRKVADLLRADPERRWSVTELAGMVHLSRSQLFRLFVQAYGKTPIVHLTMLRVERMAYLLRNTNAPIALIAREVGWADPDFAARQFRRNVGVTPSSYRAARRTKAGGMPRRSSQSSPE